MYTLANMRYEKGFKNTKSGNPSLGLGGGARVRLVSTFPRRFLLAPNNTVALDKDQLLAEAASSCR